jgi:L-fuculose-phosphate aldolase
MSDSLKRAVVDICRELNRKGLVGPLSSGNVSVMNGKSDLLAITKKGMRLDDSGTSYISLLEIDGEDVNPVDDQPPPSSELELHLAAYRGCQYPAGAVAHIHSPWVTSFAATSQWQLPMIHYQQVLLGRVSTPVVRFEIPGTPELASLVESSLFTHMTRAVLMSNHGAIVTSPDSRSTAAFCEILEDTCRMALQARAGDDGHINWIHDDQIRKIEEMYITYYHEPVASG